MNNNVRIAKELVKLAKSLIATDNVEAYLLDGSTVESVFSPDVDVEVISRQEGLYDVVLDGDIGIDVTSLNDNVNSMLGLETGKLTNMMSVHLGEIINKCCFNGAFSEFPALSVSYGEYIEGNYPTFKFTAKAENLKKEVIDKLDENVDLSGTIKSFNYV